MLSVESWLVSPHPILIGLNTLLLFDDGFLSIVKICDKSNRTSKETITLRNTKERNKEGKNENIKKSETIADHRKYKSIQVFATKSYTPWENPYNFNNYDMQTINANFSADFMLWFCDFNEFNHIDRHCLQFNYFNFASVCLIWNWNSNRSDILGIVSMVLMLILVCIVGVSEWIWRF